MYDTALAQRILEVLNRFYPRRVPFPEVRQALPEFSGLPLEEWCLAVEALYKRRRVDGDFIYIDQAYGIQDVLSLEVIR